MNIEKRTTEGEINRGPSEAARQNAIETMSALSNQYEKIKLAVKEMEASPESDERDNALTKLYGEQRLLKDRLEMMGTKPDTIQ